MILCTHEKGRSHLQLRAEHQTIWLSQAGMAELLDTRQQDVSSHLKTILEGAESQAETLLDCQ